MVTVTKYIEVISRHNFAKLAQSFAECEDNNKDMNVDITYYHFNDTEPTVLEGIVSGVLLDIDKDDEFSVCISPIEKVESNYNIFIIVKDKDSGVYNAVDTFNHYIKSIRFSYEMNTSSSQDGFRYKYTKNGPDYKKYVE